MSKKNTPEIGTFKRPGGLEASPKPQEMLEFSPRERELLEAMPPSGAAYPDTQGFNDFKGFVKEKSPKPILKHEPSEGEGEDPYAAKLKKVAERRDAEAEAEVGPAQAQAKAQAKEQSQDQPTQSEVEQKIYETEQAALAARKSPEVTYASKLAEVGLSKEDAAGMIDQLMTKGYIEKSYPITKNRSVTFRTRSVRHQSLALDALETQSLQYPTSISHLFAVYNLSSSLRKFGKVDFSSFKPEEVKQWVSDLPEVMLHVLGRKLTQFDQEVITVVDEGGLENF